jgi:hypothetical protein
MSFRFQTAFQVENLPDEQNDNSFEVLLPQLDLFQTGKSSGGFFSGLIGSFTGEGPCLYRPIVEGISFQPQAIKTEARRIRNYYINIPVDFDNMKTVDITLFCSQSMLSQYYLDAWQNLIFNKQGEYFNPVSKYKKDIEIYFYGAGNIGVSEVSAVAHFTMKGAFPISQSDYKLSYTDNPKRLTLLATFAYDRLVPDLKLAKKGFLLETLSSGGMTVLDGLISNLTEDSKTDLYKTFNS